MGLIAPLTGALLMGASMGQCTADLNGDGEVNGTDLAILLANWGSTQGATTWGDLNGDGAVDQVDMNVVLDEWGCRSQPELQLRCEPSIIHTGVATPIVISIELPPAWARQIGAVEIVPVTESGMNPGAAIAVARDSGASADGDAIGGDGIFTAKVPYQRATPSIEHYAARIELASRAILTAPVSIEAFVPVVPSQVVAHVGQLRDSGAVWQQKLAEFGDTEAARFAAVEAISALPGVASASLSSIDHTTIVVESANGLRGLVLTRPETEGGVAERRGGGAGGDDPLPAPFSQSEGFDTQDEGALQRKAVGTTIGNERVLIWAPENNLGDVPAQFASGPKCFDVDLYTGNSADVFALANINTYGTVIFCCHGGFDQSGFYFQTGEIFPFTDNQTAAAEEFLSRYKYLYGAQGFPLLYAVGMDGKVAITIGVEGIEYFMAGRFDRSIIYLGACHSMEDASVPNMFLRNGASACIGWGGTVHTNFNREHMEQLFGRLLDGDPLPTAWSSGTHLECNPGLGCAEAVVRPVPIPFLSYEIGANDTGELDSPGFERDGQSAWVLEGDAKIVQGLGSYIDWSTGVQPVAPTEGDRMLRLAAGASGPATGVASATQEFTVPFPETAGFGLVSVSFDWAALRSLVIGFPPPDDTRFRAKIVMGGTQQYLFDIALADLQADNWTSVSAQGYALFSVQSDGSIDGSGLWSLGEIGIFPHGAAHAGECATIRFELVRPTENPWVDVVLIDNVRFTVF